MQSDFTLLDAHVKEANVLSRDECEEKCNQNEDFVCRSYAFGEAIGGHSCLLSPEDGHSLGELGLKRARALGTISSRHEAKSWQQFERGSCIDGEFWI